MTITVARVGTTFDVFSVYVRPHWLRRLFGAKVQSFHAVRSPALMGGFTWLDDWTGRVIRTPEIIAALDEGRALEIAAVEIDEYLESEGAALN